jgi:hypothetical protein
VAQPRDGETFRRGDRVRIERDETRWPATGTWPRYRGRTGIVTVPDNDGEIGVQLGHGHSLTWFLPDELTLIEHADTPAQEAAGATKRVVDVSSTGGML